MLRKFALLAAMLTIVVVAIVPALAQDGYETQFALVEDSDVVYPVQNRGFSCGFLSGDPSTVCIADEDGFFTAPSSGVVGPVRGARPGHAGPQKVLGVLY